ncbi:MAG: hypothetical protein KDE56_29830 [Anaerolineales bacterium]|nr:hypothetical protein [Anaerolineales bacterium]
MQNYRINRLVLACLALLVVASYGILLVGQTALDWLIKEDGLIESVGTVGYFVAGLFFLGVWWQRRREKRPFFWFKQLAYIGLAAMLIFVAGEEISWGQRIFNFDTPDDLREINTQDEFNFHNLEVIQGNSLLNTDRLLTLFALGFTLILPITAVLHPPTGKWLNQLVPVTPWLLGLLFLLNYIVANAFRPLFEGSIWYQSSYPLKHSTVELKEAIYGLLFAVVGYYVWRLTAKPHND